MHKGAAACLCLILAAGPLAAGDFVLVPPIDCDLDEDCYIQQYVDHDPSGGAMDFRCSTLSYDTHKGTDFALKSLVQMERGINVLPAAPGTVRATRDGMRDRVYTRELDAEMDGRDCGNGVVIDHGNGWSTQYCHLKQGSVAVSKGDRVGLSTVIGQVGMSGRAQFPHVQMTLRKDGEVVDPFAPGGRIDCAAPDNDTLWLTPPVYRPGGILSVGFADMVPEFSDIKAGRAAVGSLPQDAPALVVFGYAFGGRAGDRIALRIDGPDGLFMDKTVTLEKDQAQLFRAVGRKWRRNWPPGTYIGTVSLLRDGEVMNSRQGSVTIP